ncbi:unnamed protein product [Clonostachys chloroleuca]|uniref:Ricin B lectin domain-containing protein n=1 Tax=Clonostachys chloroleuca TaxID=1926264 RepID=A0AA35M382_9HYPO|nr:unnamed protein product [Clonostachys chloroleuca]
MVDFTVKDDLDSNAWYQLTEERVDNYDSASFGSSLTVDTGKGTLSMQAANKNYYQFLPVDNKKGRYAIRNSMTGIRKQLSVCYVDDEIADGKTQPCFVTSDGSDEQKWDIADWGNKTYSFLRLTNAKNGTNYYLDCHKGNPPFMSNQIDTNVYQPAQRWLYRSREAINDGGFSTTFTNLPTSSSSSSSQSGSTTTTESGSSVASASASTTASSTSTSSPDSSNSGSSNSGISSGAAAGIGIGVALGIIGIALAAFFFWWRRRNQAGTAEGSATELPAHGIAPASDGTSESHYHKPMHSATAWSMAESHKDRQSPYVPHSSPPPPHSAVPASEMSGDNTRHELEGGYQNPFGR